jgi:hypothetical protein
VNDDIMARARELLTLKGPVPGNRYWPDRTKLRQIVAGKVKSVDVHWWREENGVAPRQVAAKAEKGFEKKLTALKAMADPARNPNAHERQVAQAAFAKLQAAGAPKAPHTRSAPGLEDYDREQARLQAELDRINARMFEAFKAGRARREAERRNAATDSVARSDLTDSVAGRAGRKPTDSVASPAHGKPTTDSVARQDWLARRTAQRAKARAGLRCLHCGKPLNAQRPTARFCNATCRSHAFRGKEPHK